MICPKCHRPLEGDEVYICCGTASVAWRCGNCHKVSEGFAFPYGSCPKCGGTLKLLDARSVDEEQSLAALRKAFEIELGGHAFYSRAARSTDDPVLKDLFESLAKMEEEHMETLANRYHAAVPEPSPDFQIERAAIFAGIENRSSDPDNLFRIAIGCEERAAAYFTEQSKNVPAGSAEDELYRELAAEERDHVDMLSTAYECWRADKPALV